MFSHSHRSPAAIFTAVLVCLLALSIQSRAADPSAQQLASSADSALRQLQTALGAVPADQGRGKKAERGEFVQDNNSIQRNLQQAVPGLLNDVRSSPENLGNMFRLYRDIEAVYQVALRALEAASRFSPRQEVDNLSAAVEGLRQQEDQIADFIQHSAAAQIAELQRYRGGMQSERGSPAAQSGPAPTHMVIDADAEAPAPKPKRKRHTAKPAESSTSKDQQQKPPSPQ